MQLGGLLESHTPLRIPQTHWRLGAASSPDLPILIAGLQSAPELDHCQERPTLERLLWKDQGLAHR